MVKNCKHCNKEHTSEGDFCCCGCRKAYKLVNELDLDNFYKYKSGKIEHNNVDLDFIPKIKQDFVIENADNTNTINLVAEGVKCAACCWLIENALLKNDGVKSVNINLFNKKIAITYDKSVDIDKLVYILYSLGYKVFPYTESVVQKMQEQYKKSLLKKMAVAAFFTMNIMLFSVAMWFGEDLSHSLEQLFKVLSFILAIPAVIYSGSEFFKSAFNAIKHKSTNMDIAISVAIILSFIYSAYHTFIGDAEVYFESCLMLIFFLLVGRFLEFKTKEKITLLTENIILSDVKHSTIIKDNKYVEILSKNLQVGDIILLQKGEKLATDGILLESDANFDTSAVTGEFEEVTYKQNQELAAGFVLMSNTVKVKAINSFKDNSLSQIVKIINDAKESKGKLQNLAERISKLYVPVVHILAFLTFAVSYFMYDISMQEAITRAIGVLIITCPCALALAIPVANTALLSRLYQNGILVKNADVLESLEHTKSVVYDKTGTLVDVAIAIPNAISANDKQVLKALAVRSKHILSKKIVDELKDIDDIELTEFTEQEGLGVSAKFNNQEYKLGSAKFCNSMAKSNLIFKTVDKNYSLPVEQKLNNNVEKAVNFFKQNKLNQLILSGDKKDNVQLIANKLNIDYLAEQSPVQKVEKIKEIKQQNNVMYIGDGINDAASLSLANISVSFAKASQLAQVSADVIMQKNNFNSLILFYSQVAKTKFRIKQNLAISLMYNAIAIPFAVFGFVSPFFAALLMSSSSICVIVNTIRR